MKRLLTAIITVLCLNGCSTHLTDLTMISNKSVTLDKVDVDRLPQNKHITGEDNKFMFLFIPFGAPTLKGALNDALEKGNGDLMVNASVYSTGWWFLIGQFGISIEEDVVNTKSATEYDGGDK